MNEQTLKCPICGKPYKVYAFYAGDQSACQECVRKAETNAQKANSTALRAACGVKEKA